jgi:hypothetical protein
MKNKAVINAEELAQKECQIISNKTYELIASFEVIRNPVTIDSWKGPKTLNDVEC